ncbi:hypothetical protein EVAR_11786_1 [Eumeta japonica]|uniref:Uncharacterized protein n=1 Tax=Eumeta variegata TaxID=151549 RepID=A0A4C1UR53_EUMVA|nr:hypothetical protein EVAR_11786_1 [Eumeta japonica]
MSRSEIETETETAIETNSDTTNRIKCDTKADFGAARLDPCELRIVVPYTYTLSERSAELHVENDMKKTAERAGELEFKSKTGPRQDHSLKKDFSKRYEEIYSVTTRVKSKPQS